VLDRVTSCWRVGFSSVSDLNSSVEPVWYVFVSESKKVLKVPHHTNTNTDSFSALEVVKYDTITPLPVTAAIPHLPRTHPLSPASSFVISSFLDGRIPNDTHLVDEHAKLKTRLKTKRSSQPRATSPTCVSQVTHGDQRKSHGSQMNPTRDPTKDHTKNPTKNPTKTIGPRDPMSEESHKHTGCNLHRSAIGWNLRSSHDFIIISEPNVLIWLR